MKRTKKVRAAAVGNAAAVAAHSLFTEQQQRGCRHSAAVIRPAVCAC